MKTIIAGSRSITDYDMVRTVIERSGFDITTVISGTARGVDILGERWAKENDIDIIRFPANWTLYGKRAGYLRNVEMAYAADACICVYDGVSKGTSHMIEIAVKQYNLPVFVYNSLIRKYTML